MIATRPAARGISRGGPKSRTRRRATRKRRVRRREERAGLIARGSDRVEVADDRDEPYHRSYDQ